MVPRRVLGLGRRDGVEVSVICFVEEIAEGTPSRHTGYLVRLPEETQELRLTRTELRRSRRGSRTDGLPELVRELLAAVPPDTESLDVVQLLPRHVVVVLAPAGLIPRRAGASSRR